MHDDGIPLTAADDVAPVLEMVVEADARVRLERHVIVETGLVRKRFEQRRHAADPLVVQVGDDLRTPLLHRGSSAECEAVADEEHDACGRVRRRRQRECHAGDHGSDFHVESSFREDWLRGRYALDHEPEGTRAGSVAWQPASTAALRVRGRDVGTRKTKR